MGDFRRLVTSAHGKRVYYTPAFVSGPSVQDSLLSLPGGGLVSIYFSVRSEQVDSNSDRSQHSQSHPILTVVTPPACHSLFLWRALVRNRVPYVCCHTAHFFRRRLIRRGRFRGTRPRGIPSNLDLSNRRQTRSLRIPLSRSVGVSGDQIKGDSPNIPVPPNFSF